MQRLSSLPRLPVLALLLAALLAATCGLAACQSIHPTGRAIDKGDQVDSPEENE